MAVAIPTAYMWWKRRQARAAAVAQLTADADDGGCVGPDQAELEYVIRNTVLTTRQWAHLFSRCIDAFANNNTGGGGDTAAVATPDAFAALVAEHFADAQTEIREAKERRNEEREAKRAAKRAAAAAVYVAAEAAAGRLDDVDVDGGEEVIFGELPATGDDAGVLIACVNAANEVRSATSCDAVLCCA
jgi:hypothetical protein